MKQSFTKTCKFFTHLETVLNQFSGMPRPHILASDGWLILDILYSEMTPPFWQIYTTDWVRLLGHRFLNGL